ncbi:MAG: phosphotransferase [Desulfobacterales bacterium]|nr:phosphotransferase [Desulfobacterales bacterium]
MEYFNDKSKAMHDIQLLMDRYNSGKITDISLTIGGYANINYKVTTDKKEYLLKIHLNKKIADIVPEIKILEYLKTKDIPSAYPVPDRENKFINTLGNDNTVLYEFINGHHPEVNIETTRQIAKVAASLNLLEVPTSFTQKNWVDIDYCKTVIQKIPSAVYAHPDIFDYFIEQTSYLQEPLSVKLPRGLVHGDLFPDNTMFKGNKLLAVLDFEAICIENLLHELGTAIQGFCYVDNELSEELLHTFLNEYQKYYRLSQIEKELLPAYMQWGAHCMIAWHLTGVIEDNDTVKYKRAQELIARVKQLRKMSFSF